MVHIYVLVAKSLINRSTIVAMLYLFYGEDNYQISEAANRVVNDFKLAQPAGEVVFLNADDIESKNLIPQITTLSLFSKKRLILIRGIFANKSIWEQIVNNIYSIDPDTTLVLVNQTSDTNAIRGLERTKLFNKLKEVALIKKFNNPKSYEISRLLNGILQKRKISLTKQAKDELIARTAGDPEQLARINLELDKLSLLKRTIDQSDITNLIEPNLATNVFNIFNLAIKGLIKEARNELKLVVASGEDPMHFFALLVSQGYALTVAALGSKAKKQVNPYQLSQSKQLVHHLGSDKLAQLRKINKSFSDADVKLKISPINSAWLLIGGLIDEIANLKY